MTRGVMCTLCMHKTMHKGMQITGSIILHEGSGRKSHVSGVDRNGPL